MNWQELISWLFGDGKPEAIQDRFYQLLNERGLSDSQVNRLVRSLLNAGNMQGVFRPMFDQWMNDQVMSGSTNANDAYALYGQLGITPSAEMEKYLDNSISQGNAQTERDYQTGMRDTSLLSSANQLEQLGLSTSNLISVGGAASGVTTNAASTNMHSAASLKQQARINDYNQKMGMAKSIINMTTALGAAGVYGHSLVAAKKAAASMSSAASHSGLSAMKAVSRQHLQKGNYADFYNEFPLPQQEGYSWIR